jgi:hypothetical protein
VPGRGAGQFDLQGAPLLTGVLSNFTAAAVKIPGLLPGE